MKISAIYDSPYIMSIGFIEGHIWNTFSSEKYSSSIHQEPSEAELRRSMFMRSRSEALI